MVTRSLWMWAAFRKLPWSHMVEIAVRAVLIPVGFAIQALVLSGAAGSIVWSVLRCRRP